MALQPDGVGVVVVVADLHQHRRSLGLAHLSQGGGLPGSDLVGQGVYLSQFLGDQLRRPLALGAAGVIKGDDAPLLTVVSLRRAVGVQGQIEVVGSGVGLPDGGPGGHLRPVPLILNPIGEQVRDQGVRQQVHIVLLRAAAGDILVPLLCRECFIMKITKKRGNCSLFFPFYLTFSKKKIMVSHIEKTFFKIHIFIPI